MEGREFARKAGVTVPLFSLRSSRDYGIGEIADLPRFAEWIHAAGLRMVQLLPSFELARGESSPYGARTAFGLDPLYISIAEVPELDRSLIEQTLGPGGVRELEAVRSLPGVDYPRVRALKEPLLDAAFRVFVERELSRDTERAKRFRTFVEAERGWVPDLALYVALRDEHHEHGWSTWPEAERDRDPHTMKDARARLERAILAHEYRQFVADEQWVMARAALKKLNVELMGDLPFIVGAESADVWSHRRAFRTDVSLGAPPDAYSAEGQDWGLPAYDFDRLEQDGFAWLEARTRRAKALYDCFRIDHVVGYFRQWVKPKAAKRGHFDLPSERVQQERGRRLLELLRGVAGPGAIIAEDLGVIPNWVRSTLTELGIPGYRILPWERDGMTYRDPKKYPALSVASWSTHDTAPIALWWKEMTPEERRAIAGVMHVNENVSGEALFQAHMRTLFGSHSVLALVLVQELLGEDLRINTPGTVGPHNWAYRMAHTLERVAGEPHVERRMNEVRSLLAEAHR